MAQQNIEVVPNGEEWVVLREGSSRRLCVYPTQAEAVAVARQFAKRDGVELIIKGRDGRIVHRDSYGHDPFPPRG